MTALAEAELQRKLSASMADLRKGLSSARGLHASLRAEAAALESFIPVIVEGAKSGMQQALAKQVSKALHLAPYQFSCHRKPLTCANSSQLPQIKIGQIATSTADICRIVALPQPFLAHNMAVRRTIIMCWT